MIETGLRPRGLGPRAAYDVTMAAADGGTTERRGARPFLTAEWRYLAMLNFEIAPAVLRPYIPRGTELDEWQGRTLVSVVGFRFLDTRVRGLSVPWHRDFDEVNLRFYVRREVDGEVRRGVSFVRELVPRHAIALIARLVYNEPYVACPMRSRIDRTHGLEEAVAVEYAWRHARAWQRVSVRAFGRAAPVETGTESEFVTEHYWGYTPQRDGSTLEYEVRHPRWRVWPVLDGRLDCDVAAVYGPAFVEALSNPPASVLLAEGSAITVFSPTWLPR